MGNKLETLRSEIALLVSEYAKEQYKVKPFVPGETVIPPSGKFLGEEELQNMVAASRWLANDWKV